MTTLTENLILMKTKVDKLTLVKNLNLWGAELLDISMVAHLPNLEVLALSVNHVQSLKEVSECKNLRELYLRKNNISSLSEVQNLTKLPNLTTLWLSDNPCSKDPYYRMFIVKCCASLRQLDSIEVSPQERAEAQQMPHSVFNDIISSKSQQQEKVIPTVAKPEAPANPQPGKKTERTAPSTTQGESPQPVPAVVQSNPLVAAATANALQVQRQTQKTILTAIVTLLSELTQESLDLLNREVSERVKRKQ